MSIYTGLVVMCDAYFAKVDKLLEKCSRVEGVSDPAIENISMEVSLLLQQRTFFCKCPAPFIIVNQSSRLTLLNQINKILTFPRTLPTRSCSRCL